MLNVNQLETNNNDVHKENPCRRRRSSSLGSSRSNNGHFFLRNNEQNQNRQKCASSINLYDNSDNASISEGLPFNSRPHVQDIVPLENIFVNWYKDQKSVKNDLIRLHENNIFKTGFPNLEKYNSNEYYPPVMFIISHQLKIDTDYEIYTINNYDVRLSELMSWSSDNKKDLSEECHKTIKAINQKVVDIANTDLDEDINYKKSDEELKSNRRHSEIMGLIIANKNQPVTSFFPNKLSNGYEVVTKIGEVTVIDQARKSLRHIILSNDLLSIYATKKSERLKQKFFLKHLYCKICTDSQIQNIDSSLRIGGPFGDDLILTFSNPNSRKEWYKEIQSSISIFMESFKTPSTEITVLKHLDTTTSAPLTSKTFTVTTKTTGLELKKKVIEGYCQIDKIPSDYILTFNINGSNREYVLHDDVLVMVLQEHIGCFADSTSCNEICVSNANAPSRTHFYLKYSPSRDIAKIKNKPKVVQDFKPTKSYSYNLNERWLDNTIPEWLMILLSGVYYEGSKVEGIFRISGAKNKSDNLIQMICSGSDNNIEIKDDIHTKANTIKKFFGAIDGSLFTYSNKDKLIALSHEITSVEEFSKNADQINKILSIIQNLHRNNLHLLQVFFVVVHHISKNEAINKMSLTNLAVCLAPTVLTEMLETCPNDYHKTIILFECILTLFDKIVDESTQMKIIASLKEKRVPTEYDSTSTDDFSNHVSNTGNLNNTKDTIDRLNKSQPAAPPRRKKIDNEKSTKPQSNLSQSHNGTSKIVLKKSFKDSPSPTDSVDQNSKDVVDSVSTNTKSTHRRNGMQKRASRERRTEPLMTVNVTEEYSGEKERKPAYTFRRQGPVNRKHRDQSLSNCKINDEEPKSSKSVPESPEQHKRLNRSRKVISRGAKAQPQTPNQDKSPMSGHPVLSNPSPSPPPTNSITLEKLRSSSSSRVQATVQKYENISNESYRSNLKGINDSISLQKSKDLGNKPVYHYPRPPSKSRVNKAAPVQPTHPVNIVQKTRYSRPRQQPTINRSNTMNETLKKTLETSEEKDITFI